MFTTRPATPADAATITLQRHRMFVESGQTDDTRMDQIDPHFRVWVHERLLAGTYLGWLTSPAGSPETILAGAGLFLMDFPPHFLDPAPRRAYLLNFYVDSAARGQGLAFGLLKLAVAEARRRDIAVVSLHASAFGAPLYERNGFQRSNEMQLRNPCSEPASA